MIEFDEFGREIPDTTPVAVQRRRRRGLMLDEMRRAIREEMSREAQEAGRESFSEANDFDCGDQEVLPVSPHEFTEMHEEELVLSVQEIHKEKVAAAEEAKKQKHKKVKEKPAEEPPAESGEQEPED